MGYSIQIRYQDKLVIPKDSGYKPPNPKLPNYISLAYNNMNIISHLMINAGAVDREIKSSKDRKKCKPGTVPLYKFLLNEGYVVTAKEARLIANSLGSQDLLSDDFLKKMFPKIERFEKAHLECLSELIDLWIPFNRVAAANNGYTVK